MIVNGLVIASGIVVLFAGYAALRAAFRADDRRDPHADMQEAHAWVMRAKYGNTWGCQHIRARLTVVRSIIQAAQAGSEFREAISLISTMTSPAAPPNLLGAEDAPGTVAAAGDAAHPALPPLPPDDLGPECTYRDEAPFIGWLSDETLARGIPAIKDGPR